jgi:hypothetical protein
VEAYVWDTPLLLETGLNRQCDVVVFIDAPREQREARVAWQRGWDAAELARREKLQMPLDKKRELSDDVIVNTAPGAASGMIAGNGPPEGDGDDTSAGVRGQIQKILSRIVPGLPDRPLRGYN